MIAADTSTWINFFKGKETEHVSRLQGCLTDGTLLMPPVVLMELLSFQGIRKPDQDLLRLLPRIELRDGYWERAGEIRHRLLSSGFKARSMDCLIAQSCLDSDVPLIADDRDFRHFAEFGLAVL